MEIIRYGVSREDLHNLLRMIGVLQPQERVIAVSEADPVEGSSDTVIVTVSTALSVRADARTSLTDKELQQRLAELGVMKEAAAEELRRIHRETEKLNEERNRRQLDEHLGDDGIPDVVAMNITSQVRDILSGKSPGS